MKSRETTAQELLALHEKQVLVLRAKRCCAVERIRFVRPVCKRCQSFSLLHLLQSPEPDLHGPGTWEEVCDVMLSHPGCSLCCKLSCATLRPRRQLCQVTLRISLLACQQGPYAHVLKLSTRASDLPPSLFSKHLQHVPKRMRFNGVQHLTRAVGNMPARSMTTERLSVLPCSSFRSCAGAQRTRACRVWRKSSCTFSS